MEVEHLLSGINDHAPVGRRNIIDHMDSKDYTYRTRAGHVCEMTRDEVSMIYNACTERDKLTLRLPIIVMTDTSYEQPVWKVEGRAEVSVISKLLGKRPLRDDLIHLYHPHLKELHKMLPNSAVTVFVP
ncbi:MAG: DUF61 family protein [Methanomassiliicoccaceae archaeon]|jgi:uncharacterized protein (UPF0216 family)|nr:DUF61 family protein [Methanomassiliicoccaceae archaeon]